MSGLVYNVLFLCTGNSARSILAEALMDRVSEGRIKAYSAVPHPKGDVHPQSIALSKRMNFDTGFARPKSWDEFAALDAPKMDFVFTVCDDAAGEPCPVWSGQPMSAHWDVPDPAALPLASIGRLALQKMLNDVGEDTSA